MAKRETDKAIWYDWDSEEVPLHIREEAQAHLDRAQKRHPGTTIAFQYFKASKRITYGNLSYMRFGLEETVNGVRYIWRYWCLIYDWKGDGTFHPESKMDKLHSDGATKRLEEAIFPPGTGIVRLMGHPKKGYMISILREHPDDKVIKIFGANQWRTDPEVLKQWEYVKGLAATYQADYKKEMRS